MTTKKISGIILLLLGIVIFVVGSYQYNKSQTPNACMVSFTKSLGGKASMAFRDSVQCRRSYGISGISIGTIFALAGGILLFKTRKKRF
ncbi:MAG: hypothetical protein KAG92_03015 [Deltaproteobacteria bacterium]|nr:hypothetical protein [Deltaproteobacteria bacterium]